VLRILRNIFRRKLRAFLTIFGISIGVFSLVVMGAIAEKLTLLVDGGVIYYAGKVVVSPDSGITGLTNAVLSTNLRADLERIDGVQRASGSVYGLLDKNPSSVNFGSVPSFQASDGRERGLETFKVTYSQGREISNADRGKVVIGADLVKKLDAQLGGTVKIRDKKYTVVGIMDKTLTAPDSAVAMSMEDARAIVFDDLPADQRVATNKDTIISSYALYLKPGVAPAAVKSRIERHITGVRAATPEDFEQQIKQPLEIFTSVIYAIAAISLLVGGLSVINTMTMSVAERTREIGIRKAIGASDAQVMTQFIAESAVIGLIGGVSGLLLGLMIASVGNAAGEMSGNALFLVTPRLMIGSVVFAVVLGIVSGLYPAYHAASLSPVEALRYE
jgi:putative ABC transport system permease protein